MRRRVTQLPSLHRQLFSALPGNPLTLSDAYGSHPLEKAAGQTRNKAGLASWVTKFLICFCGIWENRTLIQSLKLNPCPCRSDPTLSDPIFFLYKQFSKSQSSGNCLGQRSRNTSSLLYTTSASSESAFSFLIFFPTTHQILQLFM